MATLHCAYGQQHPPAGIKWQLTRARTATVHEMICLGFGNLPASKPGFVTGQSYRIWRSCAMARGFGFSNCDSLDQYRCSDRAIKGALMKIVLLVVGPLFIAVGLFWFGQGTGLFSGPHNAVLIDAGAGAVALGIGLVWFALR